MRGGSKRRRGRCIGLIGLVDERERDGKGRWLPFVKKKKHLRRKTQKNSSLLLSFFFVSKVKVIGGILFTPWEAEPSLLLLSRSFFLRC